MAQTEQAKTLIKRIVACVLAVIMILTAASLGGFVENERKALSNKYLSLLKYN